MPETNHKIRIAVDAMGGDYAPEEIIKGAVAAARKDDIEVILVGPTEVIEGELAKYDKLPSNIARVRADEIIREGEHPALAIRERQNASIVVATNLVKTGEADAILSAGSTGAASASAFQLLGTVPGIERPAVCVPLVGFAPRTVLVDGGANVDCKPRHLLSIAVIGSVYAKNLLNVENPKIALLSVGAEEGKGNRLIQQSYSLLQNSGLDFLGNIEGNDILSGRANVIVCDGIIGNVLMKFYESMGYYFVQWLKGKVGNLPLVSPVKKLLDQMSSFTNITRDESGGGGLLWGVNGIVQLMHGKSQARQIEKAMTKAKNAVETGLLSSLRSEMAAVQKTCENCVKDKIQSKDKLISFTETS